MQMRGVCRGKKDNCVEQTTSWFTEQLFLDLGSDKGQKFTDTNNETKTNR